jgi:hypothetical protein
MSLMFSWLLVLRFRSEQFEFGRPGPLQLAFAAFINSPF